uniref:Ribonuclease H-like domain-containing protein n=1 Tax=Tanacetum cinerariifolium TaxID=118510 RepID=A0A699IPX5_TANCI|nr:ribonuclease H-like domain-containing protein [Tanacetum cinerariifolium]
MEEKCHFMVKEGIVLGHKISKSRIKVDRAKVDVIDKAPHPNSVKGVENLATDHLSRSENPYQDELEKKEITETFPLETLGMIAFRGESLSNTHLTFTFYSKQDMDQQYPTVAKIPMLDTGKFEQCPSTTTTSITSGEKLGRTVTLTKEDMQKKKNDVKARTTLLLSLLDEHQLRFNKHKTAKELWAVILKIFSGNEATKKTKKNLLKQQYGNFRAEGLETLELTFTRLQVIVGHLQFMGVEVEQDDLNQKFLTSLAPEWLMHTIVWRNRSDLDTMSLDDLYNHLKEINQINEDDMEEMDIKWNMELLSMRVDKFWKKTGKNISIQGSDVAGERGWDWSYMANDEEDHALVAEAPTEFALMANTSTENKTGLLECADDTVTDYSRPSPTIESSSKEDQNRNPSASENVASPITPKQFFKFVKASDSQSKSKTDEKETPQAPSVSNAEQYRKPIKKPNVRGNQRN